MILSSDYFFPGKPFHFGRNQLAPKTGGGYPVHGHADYAEIFLIEKGKGVHLVNGGRQPLGAGDLVFVRKRDRHGFQGRELHIANLSFIEGVLTNLAEKYFENRYLFYGIKKLPRRIRLGPADQEWVRDGFKKLEDPSARRWDLDSFLMSLFEKFGESFSADTMAKRNDPPAWVKSVLKASTRPEIFQYGTQALVEMSARSAENLSREVRRWTGKTPTELLNEGRLKWASEQLQKTEDPVIDLSLACGFDSLSYFYRLFGRRYGLSPLAYRERTRRAVGR